jgi:N-acetylglucosamine kinase-like BadF-type ATPase
MSAAVIAVDGGASKTHLALLARDGTLLELVRGPESSPQNLGLERALGVLDRLFEQAGAKSGQAEVAQLNMSGVDFPSEERELREAIEARRWAERIVVDNDTFAVLRAGTERGWGVAVVCGAGINCVGVAPDGRQSRFPALGWITGDWGGGYDVGVSAISAAARSEDGRGDKTTLEHAVPAHFGVETPTDLAEEFHAGRMSEREAAIELAPIVFAEAEHDPVAAAIVEQLAEEVVTMVRVTLERLGLTEEPVEVALGGGLMQSGDIRLIGAVEVGLRLVAPAATLHVTGSPPIVGAALLGLDEIGADALALARAREELANGSLVHG